ncbi:LRR and PYD domains-containing 12-like protein [Labeo rohita]|uniref:LRR and PYD domains-containing 12-like protein n=1 Tax=Labeo rohita TaxID=84645 RepID=A0A498M1J7_LABRO|nr:LRR and PYD domains-containing 12-like protein [Labeo rohita]
MKLAELAYRQLKKPDEKILKKDYVIFKEEDLEKYKISVGEASQYAGVITCDSKRTCLYKTELYSFVHLSVQEFFAAMFAFQKFLGRFSKKQDSLKLIKAKKTQKPNLYGFLKNLTDEALESKNGHLDLFTCFVFGISCDSSRQLLEVFLHPIRRNTSDDHKKVAMYIKSLMNKGLSPERCISLVRGLVELKSQSFLQEMHKLERSRSTKPLTLFQCSLLAYQFVMSDTKHDEFDLRKYNINLHGFQRFSLAITCFTKALIDRLKGSSLTEQHCEILSHYLSSQNSHLTDLDLSHNGLGLSALNKLSKTLCDPNCQIKLKLPVLLKSIDPSVNRKRRSMQKTEPEYFIALTFDSQTANDHLYLKENNTVVTCQTRKQQLPANDERFDKCNQVLCCQPLMGRCFFIVDVTGPVVHVGVACKGIKRKGKGDQVHLGRNKMSWSLRCSKMCEVHHNKHAVSVQSESIRKLGVFVDRNAGSVCFYMLSPQYKLLYMFDADFPEDQELYAAFKIQEPNSSVTLSQESQ